MEPAVCDYRRGRGLLARFPDAKLVEVASHWKILQLANPGLAEDWLKVKRDDHSWREERCCNETERAFGRLYCVFIIERVPDGLCVLLRRTTESVRHRQWLDRFISCSVELCHLAKYATRSELGARHLSLDNDDCLFLTLDQSL